MNARDSLKYGGMLARENSRFAGTGKGDWAPDHGGAKIRIVGSDGRSYVEGHATNFFTAKERKEMRKKGHKASDHLVSMLPSEKDSYGFHPLSDVATWKSIDHSNKLAHEKEMFLLQHGLVRDANAPDGYRRVPLNWMSQKPAPAKKEKRSFGQRLLYIFGF